MSMMVKGAMDAAEVLAEDGISAEVMDPRTLVPLNLVPLTLVPLTLVPLNKEAILSSLGKTGRLAVVDEAYSSCGMAAEIAALAACEALDELDAPVLRICTRSTPHTLSFSVDSYLFRLLNASHERSQR
jgi:acetoin:2,6-dichlorophenolindophenol oxidoreductase subunit beta